MASPGNWELLAVSSFSSYHSFFKITEVRYLFCTELFCSYKCLANCLFLKGRNAWDPDVVTSRPPSQCH